MWHCVRYPWWWCLPQKPARSSPHWLPVCSLWPPWGASCTPMAATRHRRPTRGIAIPPRPPRRLSPLICTVSSPSSQPRSGSFGSVLVRCISLSCGPILWSQRFLRSFLPKLSHGHSIWRCTKARESPWVPCLPSPGLYIRTSAGEASYVAARVRRAPGHQAGLSSAFPHRCSRQRTGILHDSSDRGPRCLVAAPRVAHLVSWWPSVSLPGTRNAKYTETERRQCWIHMSLRSMRGACCP